MSSLKLSHERLYVGVTRIKSSLEHTMQGKEMLPMLAIGCQASVVRGEEAGCFCEEVGMSIVVAEGPRSVTYTFTVHSRVA